MSLQLAAQHLANHGRGGDTMLVHMSPGEVHGLQNLAKAHGGSLSINPETGLPEAGFLSSILPTIIGIALAPATGGASLGLTEAWQTAALVGGVEALRTHDIGKGLMAGLGAYGGAGLGGALAGAGESLLGEAAGPQSLGSINAQEQALNAVSPDEMQARIERAKYFGVSEDELNQQIRDRAAKDYAAKAAAAATPYDKFSAGLSGLTKEAGRDAFMSQFANKADLLKAAGMAALPIAADQGVQRAGPQTVTQAPGYIEPEEFDPYTQTYRSLGRYKTTEFPGFAALTRPAPTPHGAEGGSVGYADGGSVGLEPGSTLSYQRTSMSPGMLDFAQHSEPVIRMASGGISDADKAALGQMWMGGDISGLNAALASKGYTASDVQSAWNATPEQMAALTGRGVSFAAPPAPAPAPAAPTPTVAAPVAPTPAAAPTPPTTITSTLPTQQAIPTAQQYAAQQSILKDPQAAALDAARVGILSNMTNQQIADMVNAQYGKTFSAQNVADFIERNKEYLPQRKSTPPLYPGVATAAPGEAVFGSSAINYGTEPTTMTGLRNAYVQGGGRTDMPTITDIQPTDRTYTQNQAYDLLSGYLQSNPNAMYGDVVKFAQSKGIPEMQARAAYNEFRFNSMTGGTQQAYNYLMGRGGQQYPVKPFVPGGGSIMRPYKEVMGLSGPPAAQYLNADGTSSTSSTSSDTPPKNIPDVFDPQGNKYSPFVAAYFKANPDVQQAYETQVKGAMTPEAYVQYHHDTLAPQAKETTPRLGYYPSLLSANPTDSASGAGATGGLAAALAHGGMTKSEMINMIGGASRGGSLGDYSDGGRLLRGPGDGVSDSIPATIADKRPARLADGEFVVPARIVSELGNGSTEAGARKLYAMMERVQKARSKSVGKGRVAKDTKADKYLPA